MSSLKCVLPYFVSGIVVKGFGRGSKELGIPTANFDDDAVDSLPENLDCGVYFGWAQLPDVTSSTVHKMVMCVGWNPFFQNKKKSMETHILNFKGPDFYGAILKVAITGYIREQRNFTCKDELIAAIHEDLHYGSSMLDLPEHEAIPSNEFFKMTSAEQNGERAPS